MKRHKYEYVRLGGRRSEQSESQAVTKLKLALKFAALVKKSGGDPLEALIRFYGIGDRRPVKKARSRNANR